MTIIGEDVEKNEPLYTVGRICKLVRTLGKQSGGSTNTLKNESTF